MRKFCVILSLFLLVGSSPLLRAQRMGPDTRWTNLYWDRTYRTGVYTNLAATADTASLLGASDALISRYYANLDDDVSLIPMITGGTTRRFKLIIEALDPGAMTIADSLFRPLYWIHYAGNGADSAYVNMADDSITVTGGSTIYMPLLGAQAWRIKAISKTTQVGNTRLKIRITQRK